MLSCYQTEQMVVSRKQRLQPLINQLRIAAIENSVKETNEEMFRKHKVRQAPDILKAANRLFQGRLAIAFSGGKDSLVALHLAMKTNPELPIIFSNTTVDGLLHSLMHKAFKGELRLGTH